MTATTELPIAPGTMLAHYEIREPVGSGAMGTVYRAHDTALDRTVAVKVLRPGVACDPAVVDRFVREARAAARVNHPNLTHIYFVGQSGGHRFFAMEYVDGPTLDAAVARDGPMDVASAIDAIVQAARGLAAAHGAGVVHRDVKPSNLMLAPDGTLKVADFGLAKSQGGDVAASGGGSLLGTPTYMSPEQCRGRGVDARTDVYCLGLTAWYVLAGRAPFVSESLGQMLHDQMNAPLPSLRELRPDLPPALARALAKMCEKDPDRRPVSMDEVIALLEPLRPRPLEPAPFTARATAFVIDGTFLVMLALSLFGVLWVASHLLRVDLRDNFLARLLVAGALVASQYVPEASFQTSVGKWLLDLAVVRTDGSAPGRLALFIRFLLRFPVVVALPSPLDKAWLDLTFVGLQILFVVAGAVSYPFAGGRTVSDRLTRTRVVYRRSAPATAPG
jgi:uncharacterized RDD family membrane protein YckC